MNNTFYINSRKQYLESVNEQSVTILFSGNTFQRSGDQDYPFSVNRNFYYLTGINQDNVILILVKSINGIKEYLLIPVSFKANVFIEKSRLLTSSFKSQPKL